VKKLALAFIVVLALAGCSSSDGVASVDTGDANYNTGKSYTNYLSQDRSDVDTWTSETDTGDVVTSDDLIGDVVVLNFWYAACAPCRTEAPVLESLAQKYADQGVQFYGVNVRDKADTAAGFTKEFGVSYPSLIDADTGTVQFAYASASPVTATPTTLVIDKNGRVAARILGELDGTSLLDTFISDTLAEAE
jgi:thiol-disulfide isomerase/thioredoxin